MEQQLSLYLLPDPLDQYPPLDLTSLQALKTGDKSTKGFRKGYGPELYQQIGQRRELLRCAYCGFPFDDFPRWLMMSVDHVVPTSAAEALKVDEDLWDSILNLVFCCRVCNDFNQGLQGQKALEVLPYRPESIESREEFFRLRKATFPCRLKHIAGERAKALQTYQLGWALGV